MPTRMTQNVWPVLTFGHLPHANNSKRDPKMVAIEAGGHYSEVDFSSGLTVLSTFFLF